MFSHAGSLIGGCAGAGRARCPEGAGAAVADGVSLGAGDGDADACGGWLLRRRLRSRRGPGRGGRSLDLAAARPARAAPPAARSDRGAPLTWLPWAARRARGRRRRSRRNRRTGGPGPRDAGHGIRDGRRRLGVSSIGVCPLSSGSRAGVATLPSQRCTGPRVASGRPGRDGDPRRRARPARPPRPGGAHASSRFGGLVPRLGEWIRLLGGKAVDEV